MENSDLLRRVRELRAKKGLSQEQLAEESGLSLRTIQRIENGETVPRGDTLKRLAVALKVSPDEIIDWQIIEDKNVLAILNLSQFGYLVFPLLGIIIPLAIWILKKDKVKYVDEVGKAILNFQISWVIILFLSSIIIIIISLIAEGGFLPPALMIITIGCLYLFNAIVIIVNTLKILKGKSIYYRPALSFLH